MNDRQQSIPVEMSRISRRRLVQAAGAGVLGGGFAATTTATRAENATPVPGATPELQPQPEPQGILTYPRHGTVTASPGTEISFRGISRERLGDLRVSGSESGGHSGVMMPHQDGLGVSFVPDRPFGPGEEVTVSAHIPLSEDASGDLVFEVSVPLLPANPPAEREENNPLEEPHRFRSLPHLRPPVLDVLVDIGEAAPGLVFLSPRMEGGQSGAYIVDNTGEPVWFHKPGLDMSEAMELRVQEYHGQPVLTWWQGAKPIGYGVGHFVIANAAYEPIAHLQVSNGFQGADFHEFLITSRDTAILPIYAPVEWDLSPYGGPANGGVLDQVVQEVEIETGRVLYEWHALDHIEIDESYEGMREDRALYDYVHFNSIAEDPDGNLILSCRHLNSLVTISRTDGEILWRLNGKRSDFEMGEGASFVYQHDARNHGNGLITLLDNGTGSRDSGIVARGLALQLDYDNMTAEMVAEYLHPTEGTSHNQANMQRLPNGNYFLGWGPTPDTSEVTPEGEVVWHAQLPEGGQSYRAYRFPWAGMPAVPPDVAVETDGAGGATIYVSWNGATGVTEWQVVTGASERDLQPITTVSREGFETAIDVDLTGEIVAVRALDAGGNILAVSEPVAVPGDAS